MNTVTCITQE